MVNLFQTYEFFARLGKFVVDYLAVTHSHLEIFLLLNTDFLENFKVTVDSFVRFKFPLKDFFLGFECHIYLIPQTFIVVAQFHHRGFKVDRLRPQDRRWGIVAL